MGGGAGAPASNGQPGGAREAVPDLPRGHGTRGGGSDASVRPLLPRGVRGGLAEAEELVSDVPGRHVSSGPSFGRLGHLFILSVIGNACCAGFSTYEISAYLFF